MKDWRESSHVEEIAPGEPSDLPEVSGKPFLLVAYGLSHINADIPEATLPADIRPLDTAALARPFLEIEDANAK